MHTHLETQTALPALVEPPLPEPLALLEERWVGRDGCEREAMRQEVTGRALNSVAAHSSAFYARGSGGQFPSLPSVISASSLQPYVSSVS